jgi:uncharacterized membrane protein YedE/YeeE
MKLKAVGFTIGAAFGFIVGWARLTDYDVIRDMLLLRHPDVFLVMMSAMVTAAIGARLLRALHVRSVLDARPIAWTTQPPQRKHVVGSVLFGIGWSLAGTCPGPVAAQLGRGQLAALFTIGGLLTGIFVHDRIRVRREAPIPRTTGQQPTAVAGL